MVVITDEQPSSAIAAANAAKANGITMVVVGLGNFPPPNNVFNQMVSNPGTDLHITNNICTIGSYLRQRFDCQQVPQLPITARSLFTNGCRTFRRSPERGPGPKPWPKRAPKPAPIPHGGIDPFDYLDPDLHKDLDLDY